MSMLYDDHDQRVQSLLIRVGERGSGNWRKAYWEEAIALHGFGHEAGRAKRSFNKGLSDALIQENVYDEICRSPAYHDTFVSVKPL
jgi:anaerobic selenocysteine-containing dehydrogenase